MLLAPTAFVAGIAMKRNIDGAGASGPRQKLALGTTHPSTGSTGGQAPNIVERPKRAPLPTMKDWLSVSHLDQRIADLTTPGDCRLTTSTNERPLFLALPPELLNLIASGCDVRAWALTCKHAYQFFNERYPLMRLATLIKLLFPASSSRCPSERMVRHILSLLGQPGLDQALYTSMDARLRAAMTLAFVGAIPIQNDTISTAQKLVREAVTALGDAALVAFSDLIDEYLRQSETVCEADFKNVNDHNTTRILPVLMPLLEKAPQALAQQTMRDVAMFQIRLPYYYFVHSSLLVALFNSRPEIFNAETSLFLQAVGFPIQDSLSTADAHEKAHAAGRCLAEFTRIAVVANRQLRQTIGNARASKGWKEYVRDRSWRISIMGAMMRTLKLSPEHEQALVSKQLRLLEIEVDNLAMLNLVWPAAKRRQRYLQVKNWLNGDAQRDPEDPFAQSTARRIGELTRLAIKLQQPELIAQLKKIIELWPELHGRAVVLTWFEEQTRA